MRKEKKCVETFSLSINIFMSKPIGGLTPDIIDAITGHINPAIRNELRNLLNGRPTNIPKGYENDFASSLRNIVKDIGAGSRNASTLDIVAGEAMGALASGLVIGQAAHIISELSGIVRDKQLANRSAAELSTRIDRQLREDPNYFNRNRGIYNPPDLQDVDLNEEKFGPTNRNYDPKTGRHFTSGGGNLNQPRNRNVGSSSSSSSSSSSNQPSNESSGLEPPIRNRLGRAPPIRNRIIQVDENIDDEDDGEGYIEGKEGEKSTTKRDPIPPLPPFIKDDPREAQRRNPEQPDKPDEPIPPQQPQTPQQPQQPPPLDPRLPNTPYNQLMRNLQTRKIQPLERIVIDTRKTNNWVALVQQINANNNYQDNLFG